MKKNYIMPSCEDSKMEPEMMICGSRDIISEGLDGITYGGIDEEGQKDPSARKYDDSWGFDDDEF